MSSDGQQVISDLSRAQDCINQCCNGRNNNSNLDDLIKRVAELEDFARKVSSYLKTLETSFSDASQALQLIGNLFNF